MSSDENCLEEHGTWWVYIGKKDHAIKAYIKRFGHEPEKVCETRGEVFWMWPVTEAGDDERYS